MLAAEYALGLLDGEDLVEARERIASEPAFAALVAEWEVRLATLADDLEPVAPAAVTKAEIVARLFPEPARQPMWRRVWLWQGLSLASLVALLALVALGFFGTSQRGPLYTAEIASEAGDFRAILVVDKLRNEVVVTRTEGAAPPGRVLQIWAHGPGEPAMSVGLWPEGQTGARLPLPQIIAEVEGTLTLGISEEPPGGSPTGSPSGRVFGTVDIPGVTASF
jgi:anti-sigma-K factor RskA